jgi:hypothetical protein
MIKIILAQYPRKVYLAQSLSEAISIGYWLAELANQNVTIQDKDDQICTISALGAIEYTPYSQLPRAELPASPDSLADYLPHFGWCTCEKCQNKS